MSSAEPHRSKVFWTMAQMRTDIDQLAGRYSTKGDLLELLIRWYLKGSSAGYKLGLEEDES